MYLRLVLFLLIGTPSSCLTARHLCLQPVKILLKLIQSLGKLRPYFIQLVFQPIKILVPPLKKVSLQFCFIQLRSQAVQRSLLFIYTGLHLLIQFHLQLQGILLIPQLRGQLIGALPQARAVASLLIQLAFLFLAITYRLLILGAHGFQLLIQFRSLTVQCVITHRQLLQCFACLFILFINIVQHCLTVKPKQRGGKTLCLLHGNTLLCTYYNYCQYSILSSTIATAFHYILPGIFSLSTHKTDRRCFLPGGQFHSVDLLHFLPQLPYDLLFQPRDIGLRDPNDIRYLLLGAFLTPVQPKSQPHNTLLPLPQAAYQPP